MIPENNKSEGGVLDYEQRRRRLEAELKALRHTVATQQNVSTPSRTAPADTGAHGAVEAPSGPMAPVPASVLLQEAAETASVPEALMGGPVIDDPPFNCFVSSVPASPPVGAPVIDYRLTAPIQRVPAAPTQNIPANLRAAPGAYTTSRGGGFPLIIGSAALLGGVLIAVAWSRIPAPQPAKQAIDTRYSSGPRADLGAARPGGRPDSGSARSAGGLVIEPVAGAPAPSIVKDPVPLVESPAKSANPPDAANARSAKHHHSTLARTVRHHTASITRTDEQPDGPGMQPAQRSPRVYPPSAASPSGTIAKPADPPPSESVAESDRPAHYMVVDVSADNPVRTPKPPSNPVRQRAGRHRTVPKTDGQDEFTREAARHPAPGWDEQDDKWLDRF